MMVASAALEATFDVSMPSTILSQVIWSQTVVATSSVSSCIVTFVCSQSLEVITVEQFVFGFAE
jgi:hypothetical protein